MRMLQNDNKGFKVQFSATNNFKPKFSKEEKDFKPKVVPQADSPEEVYYDEVVYYDGGGVDGWLQEKETLKP